MPGSANPIGLASHVDWTLSIRSPYSAPLGAARELGLRICGTFSLTSREGPSTILLSEVKDMGDEAQDYTATGQPTRIFDRGDGTGIDNGVVAQGKITGVTGIGLAAPGTSPADQPIGVVERVRPESGLGHQPEGTNPRLFGWGFGGGVGVRGSTEGAGGIGVDGGSNDGIGVKTVSARQTTRSSVYRGAFARAASSATTKRMGRPPGQCGRTNSPQGSGVFGFSDAGGIGVGGFSNSNDGVVGVSRGLRKSGVFGDNSQKRMGEASGSVAEPIHLRGSGVFGFSDAGGIGVGVSVIQMTESSVYRAASVRAVSLA